MGSISRPAPGKKRRLTRLARQGRMMTAVLTSRVNLSRPALGKKRRWTRTAGRMMTMTAASASRVRWEQFQPAGVAGQDQPQEER